MSSDIEGDLLADKKKCPHYQVNFQINGWYCVKCGLEFKPVRKKGDVHG